MKRCPFCAEEIQEEAIKCRFCNEFLQEKEKWYYSNASVIIGLLAVGPLALPLVWMNPRYNLVVKVVITVVLLGFTAWSLMLIQDYYQQLMQQLNDLGY